MASITKHKNGWRVQVYKKGKRASGVFATKSEAKFWAAEKEIELAGGTTIATSNRTVGDLFRRYREEVSPGKKGGSVERTRLQAWEKSLFAKTYLDELSPAHVAAWRDDLLKAYKPGSVLRNLSLLSGVFTVAHKEWGWLKTNPLSDVSKPKMPKHRDRRITDEELSSLLEGLGFSGQVVDRRTQVAVYLLFALETAMRLGEICALNKDDIYADYAVIRDSKNGDKRFVPLSTKARELAGMLFVLPVDSGYASNIFTKCVKRQGLLDLHFHDTRHEACTRLAKKLSVLELARMIGHRDLNSLMIYFNATPSELAAKLD